MSVPVSRAMIAPYGRPPTMACRMGHWHPRAVEEFHAILLALEAASPDDDLTAFRIPKDMMKPRVVSMRPATFRTPGHVNCSDEVYRDPEYAKRQVEGVTVYFDSRNPLRL
jgi:hypothetical protein